MKLISDWKQVWKWYSTHAMVIYMALVSYYVSLEPTVKEQIPNWMLYTGIVIAGITFIIARITQQAKTNKAIEGINSLKSKGGEYEMLNTKYPNDPAINCVLTPSSTGCNQDGSRKGETTNFSN